MLPTTIQDFMSWSWEQIAPYGEALRSQDLTADTLESWLKEWSHLKSLLNERGSRLGVAVSQDTTDAEAEKQYMEFYQHIHPEFQKLEQHLNQKFVESGLEPDGFEIPLRRMRTDLTLFREENLPLQTEVRRLSTEYDKIIGGQTIEWENEERTLTQLKPLMLSHDRALREQVWRLTSGRQLLDRQAINDLWVKLLENRLQQAKNADFPDYRSYRWQLLKRFDYTPDDCLRFHEAIEQVVVPAAQRIYERKRIALQVDTLRPWDIEVDPLGREPLTPFKEIPDMEQKAESMLRHVHPVLGGHFATMREERLLDLDNRKGKAPGGYCTDFPIAKRPFIFMNAVGLHDDVQTLLHESGHAFHVFESVHLPYAHQMDPDMEFCEVASMAMELLASPYFTTEFGGYYSESDAARARIEHLEGIITFWPYMAVVDAFQHWIYTHPQEALIPSNCDAKWSELWDRFMIGIDYSGFDDVKVTGWHRKLHIHQAPFYYIEYGLAQLGAVQVWRNSLQDQAQAVDHYRQALALGGTVSLPELYEAAGAKLSFDADMLQMAVDLIETTIQDLEAVF